MRSGPLLVCFLAFSLFFGGLFLTPANSQQFQTRDVVNVDPPVQVSDEVAFDGFAKAIAKAARKARKNGSLTRRQARRVTMAAILPGTREEVRDMAVMQMQASGGKVPTLSGEMQDVSSVNVANINWDNLLDFLERLLPFILKLVDLFGGMA